MQKVVVLIPVGIDRIFMVKITKRSMGAHAYEPSIGRQKEHPEFQARKYSLGNERPSLKGAEETSLHHPQTAEP